MAAEDLQCYPLDIVAGMRDRMKCDRTAPKVRAAAHRWNRREYLSRMRSAGQGEALAAEGDGFRAMAGPSMLATMA